MARPLNILHLSPFYPPWSFGGDAVYLHRLAHALGDDGHHVDVGYSRAAYGLLHPAAFEESRHPVLQAFADLARERRAWLLLGSLGVRAPDGRIFNRTYLRTPTDFNNNPLSTRTFNSRGEPSGGFGYINPTATPNQLPRNGQIVARFQF